MWLCKKFGAARISHCPGVFYRYNAAQDLSQHNMSVAVSIGIVPSTSPVIAAPIAATPSAELRTIDGAAFAIFERPLPAIGTTSEDTQYLHVAGIRIDAEGAIAHTEPGIGSGQFT